MPVTELSRWGRSTTDLLATLKELEARRVSVVALNGMTFDLATPHGRMMATVLAGIAEFERELIQERIRSGIAAAKGARHSAGPPAWAAAKIRPTGAESRGACRKGTQLSFDRARGGAEQEYCRRHSASQPLCHRTGRRPRVTTSPIALHRIPAELPGGFILS